MRVSHATNNIYKLIRFWNNFISIDFKFGMGDYVWVVTNPDKVGSGPMSDRDAT